MDSEKDAAFMVDLLMGTDYGTALRDNIKTCDEAECLQDIKRLRQIVDRLRAQTIHIVSACRRWKFDYDFADHALERRYLAYEGVLCKQDLRQHWALYRHAMKELYMIMALVPNAVPEEQRRPLTGSKVGRKPGGYGKRKRTSRKKVA